MCNYLESQNYIFAYKIDRRIFKPIVVFKNETEIDVIKIYNLIKINQILYNRTKYEFFPSPELEAYKIRQYLTYTQKMSIDEARDRRKAQKFTIITALASIIFGLLSIILQITFSGIERDVKIININELHDTIKLKIVDTAFVPNSSKDTIK